MYEDEEADEKNNENFVIINNGSQMFNSVIQLMQCQIIRILYCKGCSLFEMYTSNDNITQLECGYMQPPSQLHKHTKVNEFLKNIRDTCFCFLPCRHQVYERIISLNMQNYRLQFHVKKKFVETLKLYEIVNFHFPLATSIHSFGCP